MLTLIYTVTGVIAFLFILSFIVKRIKKSKTKGASKQRYSENEQLYIGNLSYQVNGHHLKQFFAQYGEVQSVRLIKNPRTGRSKGFAFVTYATVKDAKKALAANGQDLRGRAIVVRMAKPRDAAVD